MKVGCFLSPEEFTPAELVQQARWAQEAGFEALWISDHFHPWNDEQGESSFVWSMIGAISQVCDPPVTTAVTCPTVRIHPGIIAQAAATSASLLDGKSVLGIGSGEALNEHIFGDVVNHRGEHYLVEQARLYTLPAEPPKIYISAFGQEAADLVKTFRDSGGAGKPTQAGSKVCVDDDADRARKTVHRLWANEQLPGELAQVLPTPQHFTQASTLVSEDMISNACGNDKKVHLEAAQPYVDAGYDEIYVNQIGPNQQQFFELYRDLLPDLRALA